MVCFTPTLVQAVLFAAVATALPLNINLGAYSPAIVVGDGAIGFSGGKEGAAAGVAAALAAGTTTGTDTGTGTVINPPAPVVAAVAAPEKSPSAAAVHNAADPSILSEPATLPVPGSAAKELDPRL